MKSREPTLEPELEALLKSRRIERRAPPEVRARTMARVRAIVAAGGRIPPISALVLAPPPSAAPLAVRTPIRILVPASLAAALVAIGAVAALPRATVRTAPTAASAQPLALSSQPIDDSAMPAPAETLTPVAQPKPARSLRHDGDAGATELELLARAQAAYTHRDFMRAIVLISELNRRFPDGHLAEEREALRIRSLLGAGRTEEGQRAATAFATRFPRSVLLPKQKL